MAWAGDILPVTSGRKAVRRMRPSSRRSITSFSAAVPPAARPIPISACSSVHVSELTPAFSAAK
jgi:hypothetical protein